MAATHAIPRPAVHANARGLVTWLTTVDHKRIGLLYGVTAELVRRVIQRVAGPSGP